MRLVWHGLGEVMSDNRSITRDGLDATAAIASAHLIHGQHIAMCECVTVLASSTATGLSMIISEHRKRCSRIIRTVQ